MPRRAKLRPDEPGREKILEAGLELFADRGFHATAIAEIGERAGIAKSVLYHYFSSKAGLYEAIVESETQDLIAQVADGLPADPAAPRLRAGVDAYLRFISERPGAWRLLVRDPPADPALIEVHRRLAAERQKALSALIAAPGKQAIAAPQVELVATAIRTFAAWWYEHREIPQERIAQAIMDVAHAGAHHLASHAHAVADG
jgi:AcrR family transcriptional regulator